MSVATPRRRLSETSRHRPEADARAIAALTRALAGELDQHVYLIQEGSHYRINFSTIREVDLAVLSRCDCEREAEYRPAATWIDTVPVLMVLVSIGPEKGSPRGLAPYRGRGTNTVWQVDLEAGAIHVLDENGFRTCRDTISLPEPLRQAEFPVPALLGRGGPFV